MKRVIILLSAISILFIGLVTLVLNQWLLVDLPDPTRLYQYTTAPSTKIFDRNGILLYEITDPHQGLHTPLMLDDIPAACINATISTEDATFYQNPGVDGWAIVRAAIINLRGGQILSGGSTITQQLARNLLLSPQERTEISLTRKLREAILAWRLAQTYSKDDILTLYLNETYYGNLAYGLEAASRAYFGKHAAELDLAECAMLAGLPQSPANYNPLENPEAARARQNIVLDLMAKQGYISTDASNAARREKLGFAAVPFPIEAPHFVMYIRGELEHRYGLEAIYRQGLQVHTTLDVNMQRTALRIARHQLVELSQRRDGEPPKDVRNAAVTVFQPHTGEILAMVGSPDYFEPRIDGAVNAAVAVRQPGSSIKPLTYAAAFDPEIADLNGFSPLTAASMMVDVRTAFVTREGQPYIPVNYDHQWRGPVLLRPSLAGSYNLIAVKVLDHIGLKSLTDLARTMGISTFDNKEFGLALTLGGGEVRLLELTAAYGALANGGYRVEPVGISQITNHNGDVIFQRPPQVKPGPRILDARTAYLITNILSDSYARRSTFGASGPLSLNRPAAVKTGTTQDWRDNWTIGYTPDMVVGVWVGNADNEPMRHISGVTGAAPIWHDVMDELLKSRPTQDFVRPDGLVSRTVCADNGLIPGDKEIEPALNRQPTPLTLGKELLQFPVRCPHTITELFIEGTEPARVDDWHEAVAIDRRNGLRAGPGCKLDFVTFQVFTRYPAEAESWAAGRGVPLPPEHYSPHCPNTDPTSVSENRTTETAWRVADEQGQAAGDNALTFTSPDQGSVYRLVPNIPLDKQKIRVSVRPTTGIALGEVTLRVNGQPLAAGLETLWQMSPGTYTFDAVGTDAAGKDISAAAVTVVVIANQLN